MRFIAIEDKNFNWNKFLSQSTILLINIFSLVLFGWMITMTYKKYFDNISVICLENNSDILLTYISCWWYISKILISQLIKCYLIWWMGSLKPRNRFFIFRKWLFLKTGKTIPHHKPHFVQCCFHEMFNKKNSGVSALSTSSWL